MGAHRPDETRRRVIGALTALGAMAAFGSVMRSPDGSSSMSSTVPAVPGTGTTSTSSVTSTTARRSPASTTSPPATLDAVNVTVACREAWGARAALGGMVPHRPERLTLHHTAVSLTSSSLGPARARQHQQYHQSLGWPDLAYHFLVDRTGLAYEGRDVAFRGDTGTRYDPTGHFLVCIEGDFDTQEPTAAQVSTATLLFAWASQEFGIEPSSLAGHGDYADTTCPGASVAELIPSMAERAALTGTVSVDRRCGVAGAELIAAIEAGRLTDVGG